MKQYLLDTAPLGALLRRRSAAISLITPWLLNDEVATSVIAYGEIIEYIRGWTNYRQRQRDLRLLLRRITPYRPTYETVERCAELRRQLRPPFGPGLIGDLDTLIAATALERNLTLVTTDSDFQRVSGLKLLLLRSLR
jgi:predicted nucleic acid-binding protein